MFGLGWNEMIFVAALAVVVVGPDRLPEMLRFLGRQYGKLRRASDELRSAFMFEADKVDQEKRLEELRTRREAARKRADEIRRRALEAKGKQPDLSGIDPAETKAAAAEAKAEAAEVKTAAEAPPPAAASQAPAAREATDELGSEPVTPPSAADAAVEDT